MEVAKQGLGEHGTNWTKISTMVVTKTEAQCKNFYFNYRRKLALDSIIKKNKNVSERTTEMLHVQGCYQQGKSGKLNEININVQPESFKLKLSRKVFAIKYIFL